MDRAKGTSKFRGFKPATATASAGVTSATRLKPTRKVEPIYSEVLENDAACMPMRKAATKVKKSAPPDIAKADEEMGPPSSHGVKASLRKDMLGVARPAKSLNTSDDDHDNIKSKSKSKINSSQKNTQGKSYPVYLHPSALNCQKMILRTNQRKNPLPRECSKTTLRVSQPKSQPRNLLLLWRRENASL